MSYLNEYLTGKQLKKTVAKAKRELEGVEFDAIAVRGTSGLLVGAPLAMAMGKGLLIVRKSMEHSHSSFLVEGSWRKGGERILILDDFVALGITVREIYNKILTHCIEPEVIGVYLYSFRPLGKTIKANDGTDLPIFPVKES